jgi:uncharacterized protein
METLYWLVALALVVIGIVGTVVPALPGAPLVFAGLLVGAWIDKFQKVGWVSLGFIALLALSTYLLDFLATRFGAQKAGASPLALTLATVGMIVGIFFGIPGIILAPFIGAALGEYISKKDVRQAGKAGLGTWLGILLGSITKLVAVLMMIGIFAVAYFFWN